MADIVSLTVRVLRAGIVRCAFVRRIGRDVRGDGEGDVLRFPKQREQHQHTKHGRLDQDGKNERAATNAACATALLGVAFDETSS